ncbi:hypothetical protein ACP275_07G097400 [Erythranthe tilingii]
MELKLILLVVLFIFSSPEKIESNRLSESVVAESPYNNDENYDYNGPNPYWYTLCHSIECDTSDDHCSNYDCRVCGTDKRCLPF